MKEQRCKRERERAIEQFFYLTSERQSFIGFISLILIRIWGQDINIYAYVRYLSKTFLRP
jgi:hypothetical protein